MLSEWELWACANWVLQSHGEHAATHAAEQIEALVQSNDPPVLLVEPRVRPAVRRITRSCW